MPENVKELTSFLGLATYCSRFILQFATITEPLRRLLETGVPFNFGHDQQDAFQELKRAMTQAETLAYYV